MPEWAARASELGSTTLRLKLVDFRAISASLGRRSIKYRLVSTTKFEPRLTKWGLGLTKFEPKLVKFTPMSVIYDHHWGNVDQLLDGFGQLHGNLDNFKARCNQI